MALLKLATGEIIRTSDFEYVTEDDLRAELEVLDVTRGNLESLLTKPTEVTTADDQVYAEDARVTEPATAEAIAASAVTENAAEPTPVVTEAAPATDTTSPAPANDTVQVQPAAPSDQPIVIN